MPDSSGTQQLRDLIADLGKMPADMRAEMRPELRRSAEQPMERAKQNASWSSRIPGSISVSVSFSKKTAGVSLRSSRRKASHGRVYENMGKPGQFRTRVFGHDWWVSRRARPFLWPAAEGWFETVDENIGNAVDIVARRHGFR